MDQDGFQPKGKAESLEHVSVSSAQLSAEGLAQQLDYTWLWILSPWML